MKRILSIYPYLAPVVLLPASYWLWMTRLGGRHDLTLLALSVPIVFAYVIPGIGTNVLNLWEFHTRLRWGKFRPHHGFVFGSATSLLACWVVSAPADPASPLGALHAAFTLGSVLGFWNLLYDIAAIRTGIVVVHNRPHAEGLGPEAIAMDYAPVIFGTFGACYGAFLYACQNPLLADRKDLYWLLLILGNGLSLSIPVAVFVAWSYLKNGVSGLKPWKGASHE